MRCCEIIEKEIFVSPICLCIYFETSYVFPLDVPNSKIILQFALKFV